ncbi:hypothetical protein BH23CHL2_BH23CHL2_19720 [soil metagenome]
MYSAHDLFDYPPVETVECPIFEGDPDYDGDPAARLALVPGWDQDVYRDSEFLLVGAGANSIVAWGLLRSGARRLIICDPDHVDVTNCNRQFSYARDRGEPKAHAVARNLRDEAIHGAEIRSIALPFPPALRYVDRPPTLVVCLVDDNACRHAAAEYGIELEVPVVFGGLSLDGLRGYAFLQMPGEACLGCAFPDLVPVRQPCAAAAIKTVFSIAGQIMHLVDVALMGWPAHVDEPFNLRFFDLHGRIEGRHQIPRRASCTLCRGAK